MMTAALRDYVQTDTYPPRRPVERPKPHVWGGSVFVVDDDLADTSVILSVLERHPDVRVAQASDAPERALRQLALCLAKPDLILLDIHMPRIDGFRFLKCLRLIPGMTKRPVVFLTTSWLAKDTTDVMQSTAALYMIKPDTYAELETCLDGVVRRAVSGAWGR